MRRRPDDDSCPDQAGGAAGGAAGTVCTCSQATSRTKDTVDDTPLVGRHRVGWAGPKGLHLENAATWLTQINSKANLWPRSPRTCSSSLRTHIHGAQDRSPVALGMGVIPDGGRRRSGAGSPFGPLHRCRELIRVSYCRTQNC